MAVLSEILTLLEKWGPWKRISETPDRVDALERRLAALEEKAPKQAGKPCPACGEPAVRRTSSKPHARFGGMGAMEEIWTCSACGDSETKLVTPQ